MLALWYRRLVLLACLFLLGFALYRGRPRQVVFTLGPVSTLRLQCGYEDEADRILLARAVAGACGLAIPASVDPEPFLVWADFLPAAGLELAVAARVSPAGGLLALLITTKESWRLAAHLGPDRLGVPTSLWPMTLPGEARAGLVLTELADQMSGAFCRRETAAIYQADAGGWRTLWTTVIESEAYWNRAWDHPPGRGWLRVGRLAQWRSVPGRSGLRLVADYRNTLAEAAQDEAGRLPEEGRFALTHAAAGREIFYWDQALRLFVLGYGVTLGRCALRERGQSGARAVGAVLPRGTAVAVLDDGGNEAAALLGGERFCRVLADGRMGYLPYGMLKRLKRRPAGLRAASTIVFAPR